MEILIRQGPEYVAPYYVDIAHRTSLLYSFSCLVILEFVRISVLPEWINILSVSVLVVFFGSAVLSYIIHGALRDTENQFAQPHQFGQLQLPPIFITTFMVLLIACEVGGFVILFGHFLWRI